MEETLVEKRVCRECGADVRPDTAFCYNCGKSVTETPNKPAAEEVSSAWFGDTMISDTDEKDSFEKTVVIEEEPVSEEIEEVKTEAEPIPVPEIALEPAAGEKEPATEEKAAVDEIDPIHHSMPVDTGLKSAAAIRKKPKTFKNREVEVVWEEHGGRSNLAYLLITLVVVLFTLVVFYFAMQMK